MKKPHLKEGIKKQSTFLGPISAQEIDQKEKGYAPNIDSPINHKFLTKDNFFPKSSDLITRMEKKYKRGKAFKGKKMSQEQQNALL